MEFVASSKPQLNFAKRDFYYAIGPTIRCCRALGIFPLTLKGTANDKQYSASYFHLAYGVILMCLSIIGTTLSLVFSTETRLRSPAGSLIVITACLQCSALSILMVVIYTSSLYYSNMIGNTMKVIISLDVEFQKLGSPIDYSAELRRTYVNLGVFFMTMTLFMVVGLLCSVDLEFSELLIYLFSWMFPIVARDLALCLFTRIVLALRSRFAALNQMLENMIEEVNSPVFETMSTHQRNASKLRLIAIVHGTLCDATNNINRVFGFSIVVVVANTCIVVTSTMYVLFREAKYDSAVDAAALVQGMNWGLMTLVSTVCLVIVCSWTQIQADRAAKLIHKFNVHGLNTPLTAAVQMFSMQLNHQKVDFSAVGFFGIDPSLLQSLVGTVTTYLIILIQFDSTSTQQRINLLNNPTNAPQTPMQ